MINATRVHEIFIACLFKDGEDTTHHIKAEGVVHNIGFHPERLEVHREEVKTLLSDLPEPFMASKGGGWSFLNAPMDRNGNQWGEQTNAEELLLLGVGLGIVICQLPREMWSVLPGGVPYFVVNDVWSRDDGEAVTGHGRY